MTKSIIPESYSHVIYFQPSFDMAVKKDLTSLKHLPYVKLALDFPWEKVFASIEQDYLKARYLFYKSNPKVPQDELFLGFSNETDPTLTPYRPSTRGHKGISVHHSVEGNSDFRAACGFEKTPCLKTFERFDQIMIENGLWEKARQDMVHFNIRHGVVDPEEQLAVDTTHVEAEATLYGKRKCKCDHPQTCDCPEIPTDDNVGLLRKSNTVSYIAHKVALVCGVKSELPLSRSVFKGNDHDATTLTDTLEQVKKDLPKEWLDSIQYVSADGIYQSEKNQEQTKAILQAKLLAPINPRKIKEQPLDVRGMTKLDKYGVPHCISEHSLVLKGYDETNQQYVWTCPVFNPKYKVEGLTCSSACHVECCSGAKTGRTVRIDSTLTPQIDKEFPQHLRSFKIKYAERTAIERVIGQAKEGFSMRRVHKRGCQAVEAHVDRCIITAHALAYVSVQETGQLSRAWTKRAA
ncbi:transposase [Mycobacteroides abscessus]|uniref:transposase n=1 Tax=Mycobacteroides abscessus TaxID=36809 RepID=UPI000C26187C